MVVTVPATHVFKSSVDRFKTPRNAGAEVRVLQYSATDRTIEKSVKESPRAYSHFKSIVPRIKYPPMQEDTVYDVDYGDHACLTTHADLSPRRYAASFSNAARFPHVHKDSTDLEYDIEKQTTLSGAVEASPRKYSAMTTVTDRAAPQPGTQLPPYPTKKGTMELDLKTTPRRYSVMKSQTPRGIPVPKSECGVMYDVEYGKYASMCVSAESDERATLGFKSKVPRFQKLAAPEKAGPTNRQYEVDAGSKMSLWKSIQESPRLYSNFQTSKPQPPRHARRSEGSDVVYDTDTGNKKCLATAVLTSPRVVASIISETPRFQNKTLSSADALYDVDAGNKLSVSKAVKQSPRVYANISTKTKRFQDEGATNEAADKMYNVEYGNKASLATHVASSSIRYSNVRSTIPRFRLDKKHSNEDEYEALLRNPGKMDLRFEIRGNTVVKKTSERATIIVGRQ